jgi:7-keto-8-aminopelargonate synthetase-like enzyme
MVDDAHGLGVLGERGRGTPEHFGLENEIHLIMGTFSKSLASIGGFIAGEPSVIDHIRHTARSLIFSAALAPAAAAAAGAAIDIIESEPERREQLWRNARFLKNGLSSLGFDTGDSQTPVIPIIVGDDTRAFAMTRRLDEEGVFVNPVISPATPPGRALLRTSCMATHTEGQLSRALEACARVGREFGVIA